MVRTTVLLAGALFLLSPAQARAVYDPVATPILEELDLPSRSCEEAGKVCFVTKKSVAELRGLFDARLDASESGSWEDDDERASREYDLLGLPFRVEIRNGHGSKKRRVVIDYEAPSCAEAFPDTVQLADGASIAPDRIEPPTLDPASKSRPLYPPLGKANGIEAKVTLSAVIDEDGAVGQLCVIDADKRARLFGFVDSSVGAVATWKYRPATVDGKAVATRFRITVDFDLE